MKLLNTFLFAASAGSLVSALPIKRQSGFKWVGANESGAEFGETIFPGALGTEYIWPDTAAIDKLISAGLNIFRVPFRMERLVPDQLTGSVNETYLEGLTSTVSHITGQGAYAVVDPHNYGRYYDEIISSVDDFGAWWTTVAKIFADNNLVIFDTNNEYNTMDQELVVNLNQAAIDAIRGAGANSQYIFVEGNSWTGAWTWTDINDSMKSLTDPADLLIYEMHQYLDEDGSGTHEECVSATIGSERVTEATQWLKDNGKIGVLGEFAGGNNDVCKQAVEGLFEYLSENSDVWTGAAWWAAGPWWADYMYSLEPETGVAYQAYLSTLQQYTPSA